MTLDESPAMSHVTEVVALRPDLMRLALARVGDRHRAEDLVQETLLAAIRGRAPFEGRSRFRTWLTGILLHKVGDLFRERARDAQLIAQEHAHDDAGDEFDAQSVWRAPVNASTDPQCALESKRFREVFDEGFSKLPPRQSRAFALRELMGLEVEEVCQAMQVTPNHLGVLLHRARLQLRRSLDRDYFSATA